MSYSRNRRGLSRRMPRRSALLLAIAALWLNGHTAHAQISLSSAVDLALHSDPRIKVAEANADKARATLRATQDAVIPSASLSGGYGTSTGVPLSVPVVFSISSQSLLFNFAQHDNVRAATLGLQAATLAMQESRDQVAEDVAVTYLNLNNLQQRQAAMTQESAFAARLIAIVQDRLDAGKDSRSDLLHARRTAAQIRLQQLQMDDEIASLSDHLARTIGLPGNRLTAVTASIPALPPVVSFNSDAVDSDASAVSSPESFGIQSALAAARSKQELAFGEARYRLRPQVSFGANYSRISTSQSDYLDYYPGFKGKAQNAASIGIEITIPLYNRTHDDLAHEAAAEATRALYDAQDKRNQFLEGRSRLRHSARELSARIELAQIDRDLSQEQLDAVLVQLSADSGSSTAPLMTPKDEQNARLQERARTIDLLEAQYQLDQIQVNLLRQTGQLDAWIVALESQPSAHLAAVQFKP